MDPIDMGKAPADFYKSYVKMVLDTDVEDLPVEIDGARQKFFGSDSFAGMSKKVSQKWKEADALTRSVFKGLAKEDRERYKRVRQKGCLLAPEESCVVAHENIVDTVYLGNIRLIPVIHQRAFYIYSSDCSES
jgi:hypothetical protein